MKIAAVQMDITIGAIERNVQSVLGFIERLGTEGVELGIFPECTLTGYCFESREEAMKCALSVEDGIIAQVAEAAQAADVAVVVGYLEREGDKLFNAQVLLDGGKVVGSYRKVHLPQLGIDCFVDRGDRPYRVYDVRGARVGMAICYDSSFPEPMRVLGLEGADIIALSTNWPKEALRTASIVPAARSMENHLFFVAANRVGKERGFDFCGNSSVAAPDGIELARASADKEELVVVDIDPKLSRNKTIVRTPGRHQIDRFKDRYPACYGKIVEPIE